MARQIQGSQRDFSFGEVDTVLKRADEHPARKAALRQMKNARILNSGALQDRPGRRALYPITNGGIRTERFVISAGNVFDIQFAAGRLKIINSAGSVVANFTLQGNGAALPWATSADINSIVYAVLYPSIYLCFGHAMRPQVVTWDGVSTWSIADYTELITGGQKRTPFYRISPRGIGLQPSAQTGNITVNSNAPVFTAGWVGTRIRFIGRQIKITGFVNSQSVDGQVEEPLPGSQVIGFGVNPATIYNVGDEVIGSVTGSKGVVTGVNPGAISITVQLISNESSAAASSFSLDGGWQQLTFAFTTADTVVGPSGGTLATSVGGILASTSPVDIWDQEVMNDFQGYPASCFVDQFRVGFCDFPSLPNGIGWSTINSPTDLYVGANPPDAIFELAPRNVRIYYIVPGPEGSEFVFCDHGVYYIPISPTNPLKPGSVSFQLLSGDGAARVIPRVSQEAIIYVNAGQNSMMAVIATGAYLRPFNTKNLTPFHAHLFNNIQAIAAPSADGTFNERYAYVLNGDGSIAIGKYEPGSLMGNLPVIGWGPWSGIGVVSWVAAYGSDVVFTATYFGAGVVDILDDSQYLDCALTVNSLPAPFTPPSGKGPLWFIPSQTVSLMDQVTRSMGTYQIDANGFIVPQFNGGEDLTITSLVAGQPWTMTVEPFAPDATPGADMRQRMGLRQFSNFAIYVINSTGFMFASLFSAKQTTTSPALGTIQQFRRVPAFNVGDDATKPPTLRETVENWTPPGSSFDPRCAIVKDTPGPLQILEIAMEISI
jgi:hypothetical protein